MAAHLSLITDTAQRHANEVASGGLGDGFAQRGLADTRRPDKAQDGAAHLGRAGLHREVLDNPLLDLVQAIMIGFQHLFGGHHVVVDLAALFPRDRQHPVQVVAHHGRFRAHRAHGAQLLQFGNGLLPRLLGEPGLLDASLKFGVLVLAVPRLRPAPSGSPSTAHSGSTRAESFPSAA